jgi:Flp pilus assembly protein TadG
MIKMMHNEDGAVVVEMAISCLVLLTVLLGVFEGCLAAYTYNLVTHLAREGSRWAIVRGSDCHTNTPGQDSCGADEAAIAAHLQGMAFPGTDASRMTVTANWYAPGTTTPCGTAIICKSPGNTIEVKVAYNFPLALPLVSINAIAMGSTSRLVISQ